MCKIDQRGLVTFARELVRIPSVYRMDAGTAEGPAAELVASQMRRFGWDPIVEEVAPGRPNVFAVIDGQLPGPTLLLEGHTDVVTEGDPASWTHPPYAGAIVGGRLFGRGSADMKGGVAAMLFAAAALSRTPFPGRLVVAALADEEGMMLGVRDFVRRGHARDIDAALICEPEGGEVCIAQKGALRLRVEARGRMAHGAMPDRGDNPIPRLSAYLAACRDLEAELHREHGQHPRLGFDFVTPTVLAAGSEGQLNVIPGRAVAALDVRTTPATDHRQLLERLRERLDRDMSLEVIDDRPATETSPGHPLVRAVIEGHRRVHGSEPRLGGVPGATDGTILQSVAGVPVVIYGPGSKWIAHQVDEYVELEDLCDSAQVILEAARIYLGGGT